MPWMKNTYLARAAINGIKSNVENASFSTLSVDNHLLDMHASATLSEDRAADTSEQIHETEGLIVRPDGTVEKVVMTAGSSDATV